MATTYHQRPSSIVGVSDLLTAYCLDEVVLLAGTLLPPKPKDKQQRIV